jgi:Aerotolerance regulator N-terminal/von Willebrand factor type A domain
VSFLYPVFLFGAVAAAVPILLHLLKREAAPEVRFSAVRFLRREPTEHSRRQRLRELLLLALRVAAILLLAAAFARPYFVQGARVTSSVTIVALDTSLSMGAPGRFERARDLARSAVEQAPAGSPVGLVTFDDRPTLVVEPRVDRASVLKAIDAQRPGFGATQYGPALARAQDAIAGPGRIVVVTDLQRSGWDEAARVALSPDVDVRVAEVGATATENLSLVGLQRNGAGVLAVVQNAGSRDRDVGARLRVDGRDASTSRVRVPAGETADVTFDALPQGATSVAVAIDDEGGWPGDDIRYLVTGPQPGPRVIAVTDRQSDGLLFVQRALGAGADETFRVEPAQPGALGRLLTDGNSVAAVLVTGGRAIDRPALDAVRRHLANGGGLIVAAGPALEPDMVTGLAGLRATPRVRGDGDVSLAAADTRHPIFRAFGSAVPSLGGIRFTRTWDLNEDGWVVLARFTDGRAALMERRVDEGRVLLFASDLGHAWNDFPVHPAFVPFIHETIRYVTRARRSPRELFVGDAPEGAPRTPGVVAVSGRRVAINVDPRESDPAQLDEAAFRAGAGQLRAALAPDTSADALAREESQRYWRYGLMLMLVALAAEGFVAGGYRFA